MDGQGKRRGRRKRRGEGTVFKRGAYWVASASLGRGPDGKRKRVTVYAKTIAELNEKLAEKKREAGSEAPAKDRATATVGDLLDRWLTSVKPSVSPGTALMYDQHVRLHIRPHVGGVRLRELRAGHVEHLVARLAGVAGREGDQGPVSPAMIRKVFTTFRAALAYGVDKDLLTRNPSDAVRKQLPRRDRKVKGTLTPDEARALLAAADGDRLAALIDVALDSGCRMGELLALTWRDYDSAVGVLSITKALSDVKGHLILKEAKTKKSLRSVVLSFARPALAAHRERMRKEGRDVAAGLIFCDHRGGHLRKSNLTARFFRPAAKRAGLDHLTFHWLRHSSASLLLAAGANVVTVSERLGHASPAFTLSTYSHAVKGLQASAADQLKAILDPPRKPKSARKSVRNRPKDKPLATPMAT
jgi:integrase